MPSGKCLFGPTTLALLTRDNFRVAICERILSAMREAKAPYEVRMELFAMCPHPSDQRIERFGVMYCKFCMTLLP